MSRPLGGGISIDLTGKVRYILNAAQYPLPLSTIVKKYNIPEYFHISPQTIDTPAACFKITYYWLSRGLSLTTVATTKQEIRSPELSIESMTYFVPTTKDNYDIENLDPNELQVWDGQR